jgi:glycosyltransferase involved in cell wall biosynthesis
MPPGWASRLRPFTMSHLAMQSIRAPLEWRVLVAVHPFYLPLARQLKGHTVVYYCLDDYRLYRPGRAKQVENEEAELVRLADHTVCISSYRQEDLKRRVPGARDRIHHIPLGAAEEFFAGANEPSPGPLLWDDDSIGRPVVGYVGTLGDRVDWHLVYEVAAAAQDWSFVFIGRLPERRALSAGGRRPDWFGDFQAASSLGNVHLPGPIPQTEVGRANRCFDVCWMPYAEDHEFNRACCPTKIMDYLAGGRPVVATPLPECRLYADVITLARGPGESAAGLRSALEDTPQRRESRLRRAREHTWERQAEAFAGIL